MFPEDQFGIKSVAMEKDYHYSPFMEDQEALHAPIHCWSHSEIKDRLYVMINWVQADQDVQMIYPFGKWIGLLKNCMSFVKS